MTYEEWKKKFEKKTGEECIPPKGFTTYFLPNRGFCEFATYQEKSMLCIYNLCGDLMFWYDLGRLLCKINGLRFFASLTARNPVAFCKLLGFKNPVWEGEEFYMQNEAGEIIRCQKTYVHNNKQYWSLTLEVSDV